ncbi:MAG: hypothetical protein GY723_20530 [bacterium]|nr:hypothetical protein [bacterium]MCP5066191.1 hypothetical protein [bacterium]
MTRVLFLAIASVLIAKLYLAQGAEPALVGTAGVAVCGSMVFFGHLWADYVLPMGFWASKASDFGDQVGSAPAVAFLGWIFLALMGWGVFAK